jgi:hypothetical protein
VTVEIQEGKQSKMNEEAEETVVEQPAQEPPEVVNVVNVFQPAREERRPVAMEHVSEDTHPLVKMAMDAGPLDTASLGALMAMQKEWEAGMAKKAYTRALIAMKRELPQVLSRDKRVQFETRTGGPTTYTHTSLAAAVEAITPHVCNHGFSLDFKTRTTEKGHIEVMCTMTHRDGHAESSALAAPPETSGTKNPVQAVASTVTLLQRYTMLALLGIATKDHADPIPSGANQTAPKTVDDILALYTAAKVPGDVAVATKEWQAIKSNLDEADEAELGIAWKAAIQRIKGAKS